MPKEVLSQAEIDMLLNALSSGDVAPLETEKEEEKELKIYDFRRPNKFSKEHLRTLRLIYGNFSRLLSNFLSGFLRSRVQVKVSLVEQMTYEDFMVSVLSPTTVGIFTLEPLPAMSLMELNPGFTFPVLDIMFGGTGSMFTEVRELTEIERSVYQKLVLRILEQLTYAWSDVYSLKPKLESLESNPQLIQIISPNETVAVITLSTEVAESTGLINFCLPFITLEPLISKLSARHWFSAPTARSPAKTELMQEYLTRVEVELKVELGEVLINVRDFLRLEEGDIVPLNKKISDSLIVEINNLPKLKARPGIWKNNLAVRLSPFRNE